MMKKTIYRLLSIALCLMALLGMLAGCKKSKSKLAGMDDAEVLISVGGEAVMTVGDFRGLIAENELSHKHLGTALLNEKELFHSWAEEFLLAHFAEEFGVVNPSIYGASAYETYLEELESGSYPSEEKYTAELQEALGLDDDDYYDWRIDFYMIEINASSLLDDITEAYPYVLDPDEMLEAVLTSLSTLVQDYNVEIFYPGISKNSITFETAVNKERQ